MNRELQQLGVKYNTDKSNTHSFNNRTFLDIYQRHFGHLKDKPINILEIGLLNGSSLKVWEEYFPQAKIVGIDIDPQKLSLQNDRTKIYIGSQDSVDIFNQIKQDYPEGFDFILDDASHINDLTIKSFNLFFDIIKPGGQYVIEDTHCTYGAEFWTGFADIAKTWPGMNYNDSGVNYANTRTSFNEFLNPIIKTLDLRQGNVYAIHTYAETMIFEKTI